MQILAIATLTILASMAVAKEEGATQPLPPPGPDGMIALPGRTRAGAGYTVSSFPASFWNAIDYCKSTGRKLVAIEDSQEQLEVSLLLTTYGVTSRMWTSGVELTPGELIWASTGKDIVWSNIGNTGNGQNTCLSISGSGSNRYQWLYDYCTLEYRFLCEY